MAIYGATLSRMMGKQRVRWRWAGRGRGSDSYMARFETSTREGKVGTRVKNHQAHYGEGLVLLGCSLEGSEKARSKPCLSLGRAIIIRNGDIIPMSREFTPETERQRLQLLVSRGQTRYPSLTLTPLPTESFLLRTSWEGAEWTVEYSVSWRGEAAGRSLSCHCSLR